MSGPQNAENAQDPMNRAGYRRSLGPEGVDRRGAQLSDFNRQSTLQRINQASRQEGSAGTRTSLEQFDTFSKVTSLILKNQDVAEWTVEDVSGWIKTN